MRSNKLRKLLKENKPTIGTRVFSIWPGIAEMIGHSGIADYIEFVGENAPWDLNDLDNFARATELFDMSTMIKIDQSAKEFIAQRALGSGIQNVLFADIRSVEDAKRCVDIVKPETPEFKGINGSHNRRNVGYGIEGGSLDYVNAMNDTVIALMIEKKGAMDQLEKIASLKDIDMLQFGFSDYSLSTGRVGQKKHPDAKEAELKMIKTAVNLGIRPRVELGSIHINMDEIKRYIDLGVKDFSLPDDMDIIYNWIKENGEKLREILFQ